MISIIPDASVFIQIANFVVLVVALNYLLFKPIRGIIAQRAEKMATLGGDIAAATEGAQAKGEAMNAELAEARRQGQALKERQKAEAHSQERSVVEAATKEMEQAVAKVRAQITEEIGQAREELKGQVRGFGQDLAQKILGRSIQ